MSEWITWLDWSPQIALTSGWLKNGLSMFIFFLLFSATGLRYRRSLLLCSSITPRLSEERIENWQRDLRDKGDTTVARRKQTLQLVWNLWNIFLPFKLFIKHSNMSWYRRCCSSEINPKVLIRHKKQKEINSVKYQVSNLYVDYSEGDMSLPNISFQHFFPHFSVQPTSSLITENNNSAKARDF